MVDDHSRLAYAEVLDDLTASCAVAFLRRAVAWFAERGVHVEAVMSDNGSCYIAHAYADALRELGLRHLRIRPDRPRTNGKAERFIQTLAQRVGLRPHLRQLRRAHRSPPALPRALQLQTTTRLPRPPSAGHEAEQPRWELQLAVAALASTTGKRRSLSDSRRCEEVSNLVGWLLGLALTESVDPGDHGGVLVPEGLGEHEHLRVVGYFDTVVLVNVCGDTVEEYAEVTRILDDAPGVAGLEINISCPNVEKGGMAFGGDPRMTHDVVAAVRRRRGSP